MKANWYSYSIAFVLLMAFYALFIIGNMHPENQRLPMYYTPNGNIISLHDFDKHYVGARILYIDGQTSREFPTIFKAKGDVMLQSNKFGLEWVSSVPYHIQRIFLDFGLMIVASFLFLFMSIWFYHNTRDIHIIALNLIFSVFYASTVSVLIWHKLIFVWELSGLLLLPAILNLSLRTTGRYVPTYLLVGEIIFVLLLTLFNYVSQGSHEAVATLYKFKGVSCCLIICLALLLQFSHALKKSEKTRERLRRWVLCFGFLLGLSAPFVLIIFNFNDILSQFNLQNAILLNLLLSPSLIYATRRHQSIPFQIMVSRSLLFFLHGIFFACIYSLLLVFGALFLPSYREPNYWIVHGIFIIVLIFLLDPLQRKIAIRLKERSFQNTRQLESSLQTIASLLISHRNIQTTAQAAT